ncbi:FIST N domain protein [Pelomyxa schiedti]|nr:FIST N domain protein [Pelomyxa schiedti]
MQFLQEVFGPTFSTTPPARSDSAARIRSQRRCPNSAAHSPTATSSTSSPLLPSPPPSSASSASLPPPATTAARPTAGPTTRISTGASVLTDTKLATTDAVERCARSPGSGSGSASSSGSPGLVLVAATSGHDPAVVSAVVRGMCPGAVVAGCSTCQGVMTETGVASSPDSSQAVGVWMCTDERGKFSSCAEEMDTSPENRFSEAAAKRAATRAATEALAQLDERKPTLIWVQTAPGYEESVLAGVESVVGSDALIAGGSAADNTVSGEWWQLCNDRVYKNAVVVTMMVTDADAFPVFGSCYQATSHSGIVTRCSGRVLNEIDDKPAAEVYNRWTGYLISDSPRPPIGVYLGPSTVFPLGKFFGTEKSNGEDMYELMHPHRIEEDGSLSVFANVTKGMRVHLMAATTRQITNGIGSKISAAVRDLAPFNESAIVGSLMVFCAGCMMHVKASHGLASVAQKIKQSTNGAPFMAMHPFGEQGRFPACVVGNTEHKAAIGHGNLMFSAVIFGKATFGQTARADVFFSYCWGAKGSPTQSLVKTTADSLRREAKVTVWWDVERMGAGQNLDAEMRMGVQSASVFLLFLDEAYGGSHNCQAEYRYALEFGTPIVPVLLPGYLASRRAKGGIPQNQWWPESMPELQGLLYCDFGDEEAQQRNFAGLMHQVDNFRRLRHQKKVSLLPETPGDSL